MDFDKLVLYLQWRHAASYNEELSPFLCQQGWVGFCVRMSSCYAEYIHGYALMLLVVTQILLLQRCLWSQTIVILIMNSYRM